MERTYIRSLIRVTLGLYHSMYRCQAINSGNGRVISYCGQVFSLALISVSRYSLSHWSNCAHFLFKVFCFIRYSISVFLRKWWLHSLKSKMRRRQLSKMRAQGATSALARSAHSCEQLTAAMPEQFLVMSGDFFLKTWRKRSENIKTKTRVRSEEALQQ